MKKLLIICALSATVALGQTTVPTALPDSTKNAIVKLKDGTSLNGKIVNQSGNEIMIRTKNLGDVKVLLSNIDTVSEIRGYEKNGAFWFDNPHSSRYLFAPSAINLKKGEGYYQNAYLFLNSVNYGLSDNFSMGAGFVFNPSFRDWQTLFFTPKFSFPVAPKVRVGGGAIVVTAFSKQYNYDPNTGNPTTSKIKTTAVGILYGNGTYGSHEHNLSLGTGYGFGNGEFTATPVINIGGMTRVGKSFSLVTENWIAVSPTPNASNVGLYSGGIRIFGERMSIDLALLAPAIDDLQRLVVLPYIDFVYKFKPKK